MPRVKVANTTTTVPAESKDWMVLHAIAGPVIFLAMLHLRHTKFIALRDDKKPKDVGRDS